MLSTYEEAKEKANLAFDEHCSQWNLLKHSEAPTPQDMAAWLEARKALEDAQVAFEKELVKLVSSGMGHPCPG